MSHVAGQSVEVNASVTSSDAGSVTNAGDPGRNSEHQARSARIVPGVRQGVAARVPQHVPMDWKRHASAIAEARDQRVKALGRHRAAALAPSKTEVRDVARQFAPVETPVGSVYVQEKSGGTIYVLEKLESVSRPSRSLAPGAPAKIIVGGGAAGNAAAETLRREGYSGRITMLSADESAPCDRPNLSKGFLSRAASDETSPLRSGILSYRGRSRHVTDCKWQVDIRGEVPRN
jgi:hypothetical protein